MYAIETRNLRKVFSIKQRESGIGGAVRSLIAPRYRDVVAVDSVSLTVEPGEIVGFIGPNGAGKSTTIKMLTGIVAPTSGTLSIFGYDPANHREQLAYDIGTVFGQRSQLWYHLPPRDTYQLFCSLYGLDVAEFEKRLHFLVEAFEIEYYLDVPVRKLSLGQRMRCEIIASLLHKPKILFLDEPTIGLDVIAKQQVRDAISFLNEQEKVTIFLTSHDAGDIETLAKRSIVIAQGNVIFDDETQHLKKDFIKTKVVEFVFEGLAKDFVYEEVKIIERTKHSVKAEVSTDIAAIEKLLLYAFEHFKVLDVIVADTPLEEIIAAIYRKQHV